MEEKPIKHDYYKEGALNGARSKKKQQEVRELAKEIFALIGEKHSLTHEEAMEVLDRSKAMLNYFCELKLDRS